MHGEIGAICEAYALSLCQSLPDIMALTVRERILLFCVASGTDRKRAGMQDPLGRLALTNGGRAAPRALLPDL
jgi:hypothetical protein